MNDWSLFQDIVKAAPQDDLLESFYKSLGSPQLSSQITEECRPIGIEIVMSPLTAHYRELVIRRYRLFVHQSMAKSKVTKEWLESGTNFQVRGYAKSTIREVEYVPDSLIQLYSNRSYQTAPRERE